jgi:hypothetical protein
MEFADERGFESRPRNQPPEAGPSESRRAARLAYVDVLRDELPVTGAVSQSRLRNFGTAAVANT